MRVLLNTTRMRMKSPRKNRAIETHVPRRKVPKNTRRTGWHNWLTEENYL